EVPLAEALRQVERQTGERINAGTNLDTHITLKVNDRPLAYVLDRLAEQAGARWVAVRAVYDSTRPLTALESALRTSSKIEHAGWSKLAPLDLPINLAADGGLHQVRVFGGPGTNLTNLLTNLPPGAVVATSDDVVFRDHNDADTPGAGAAPPKHAPMML